MSMHLFDHQVGLENTLTAFYAHAFSPALKITIGSHQELSQGLVGIPAKNVVLDQTHPPGKVIMIMIIICDWDPPTE